MGFQDAMRVKSAFSFLLLSLVLLMVVPPYFQGVYKEVVIGLCFTVIMVAFLFLVEKKRCRLIVGLLLSIPVLVFSWAGQSLGTGGAYYWVLILSIAFFGFVFFELMGFLISKNTVDFNIISAAICVYFIVGTIWALIYLVIESHTPGAILSVSYESHAETFSDLTYFSFVTLTTLGYGDISPVSTIAQRWVVLEAMVGQFYLAIVIARVVAMYSSR